MYFGKPHKNDAPTFDRYYTRFTDLLVFLTKWAMRLLSFDVILGLIPVTN